MKLMTRFENILNIKFITFGIFLVLILNYFIYITLDRNFKKKEVDPQQKIHHSLYEIQVEEFQNPFYRGMDILFINTRNDFSGNSIWPNLNKPDDDRILRQIQYIPLAKPKKPKTILVYNGLGMIPEGETHFKNQKCNVNWCSLTADRSEADYVDAILFQQSVAPSGIRRSPKQIWIASFLESPYHSSQMSYFKNMFNWTATYRHDSVIPTPYGKYVKITDTKIGAKYNYAKNKKKLIAWFVSNCASSRMHYANELNKYIPIDMYGTCGTLKCPRESDKCFQMLKDDYKYYLAFENIKCRDYITEKFFFNALEHDIVPIVYGAHPDDYKRVAPPNSFIHVDDFETPEDLAEYLYKLDRNDTLYNKYFEWKTSWKSIDAKFWCRLCAILNDPNPPPLWFPDFDEWWRAPGTCQKYQMQTRWINATYKRTR